MISSRAFMRWRPRPSKRKRLFRNWIARSRRGRRSSRTFSDAQTGRAVHRGAEREEVRNPQDVRRGLAAACSLKPMRIRELNLRMMPLDGAGVRDPYCGQDDPEDHRDLDDIVADSRRSYTRQRSQVLNLSVEQVGLILSRCGRLPVIAGSTRCWMYRTSGTRLIGCARKRSGARRSLR
jgi:hypothetical protein